MHDMRPHPPGLPGDDEFPPPVRSAWWVLAGVLVLLPLAGLILLVIPAPWKALLLVLLAVLFLALLRQLMQRSHAQRRR